MLGRHMMGMDPLSTSTLAIGTLVRPWSFSNINSSCKKTMMAFEEVGQPLERIGAFNFFFSLDKALAQLERVQLQKRCKQRPWIGQE